MIVYRLSKEKHARDISGTGAMRIGNRWNPKGLPVLYTSMSRALAMAEALVHISAGVIPDNYMLVTIEIPDSTLIMAIDETSLPGYWKRPTLLYETQQIGYRFLTERKSLCLKVPSAIVKNEYNILINPLHPDFAKVKILDIEPFSFDERIFKK